MKFALLVLIASTAFAQDPRGRFDRFCSRSDQGRSDRGFLCAGYSYADVEFAPITGKGMTPECACTQPSVVTNSGASLAAVTTTRAEAAYCTKADYSLVLCPPNTARMMTGGGPSLPLGLINEYYSTVNLVIQNSDLSNAAWVKTNVTCVKNAVDPAGVTNGASTCTATAANGTVVQTVATTGQIAVSDYVKRGTGTGGIDVTVDGTNFYDITSKLSTTVAKRVVNAETVGCMFGGCIVVRQMAGNFASSPVIGFRIRTSGDSIIVSKAQVEAYAAGAGGQFSTSPIDTAGTAVARTAELHSATIPATTARSASYYSVITGQTTKYAITGSAQKDVNNEFTTSLDTTYGPLGASAFCFWVNGGNYQELYSTEVSPTMGPTWTSCFNNGTTIGVNVAGVTNTVAATVQPATALTTLWLGARVGGSGGGVTSRYKLSSSATGLEATRNVTANGVVWIGDSIATGSYTPQAMPPAELTQLIGRPVFPKGIPGIDTVACHTQYTDKVAYKGFVSLVYLCGTNNTLSGGAPFGAAAWVQSQATLTAALAEGLKVIVFNVLPYSNGAGFDANKQAAIDAYNAGHAAWCATQSGNPKVYCIDAYAVFGGGGTALLPQYDSGDGRHPNNAGSTLLATLAAAGTP